jgi:formylmethanofuran dehydrogenase subunit E
MNPLDESLKAYELTKGRLCPGSLLSLRMALLGCDLVGIDCSRRNDDRVLIVWVEIDRWLADALDVVVGVGLSKRTLKFFDYGKLAATFLNSKTGAAVRIVARKSSRALADTQHPEIISKHERQIQTYYEATDEELFKVAPAKVQLQLMDSPGRPRSRVICEICGEEVNDGREIHLEANVICRPCAEMASSALILTYRATTFTPGTSYT